MEGSLSRTAQASQPRQPYPLSQIKVELIWEGKYDEEGNRRPLTLPPQPLPLQKVEVIDALTSLKVI